MLRFKKVTSLEDIQIVSDLAYALFPLDYGAYVREEHIQYFLEENQSVKAIQHQLEKDYAYYLFYKANDLAGYLGLELKEKKLELSKIYVCQDARNQGIGEEVMGWLENYCKEIERKEIELLVLEENKRAISFYKKNGFILCEKYVKNFYTGYSETNYLMRKILQ